MGRKHDQTSRCYFHRSNRIARTGNASCAGLGSGQLGHASSRWMRSGQDTSKRCLRCQDHQTPGPQVCAMEWRRLRPLLLRGRAITAVCPPAFRAGFALSVIGHYGRKKVPKPARGNYCAGRSHRCVYRRLHTTASIVACGMSATNGEIIAFGRMKS